MCSIYFDKSLQRLLALHVFNIGLPLRAIARPLIARIIHAGVKLPARIYTYTRVQSVSREFNTPGDK